MFNRVFHRKESPLKGLVIGLASGLAATTAMSQFQKAWGKISELKSSSDGSGASSSSSENSGMENSGPRADGDENATRKAASKLARFAGYELAPEDKKRAETLVHYGFGTVMGGVYGTGMAMSNHRLRRTSPVVHGALFGTGLFLVADEFAVPALRLSGKPSEANLSTHLYGFASHLVYGLTLAGVRSLVRRVL